MKKKAFLLLLALPSLLLSACSNEGEGEVPSSSDSTDYSYYTIDEGDWTKAFSTLESFTALSAESSGGTEIFHFFYFTENMIAFLDQERKEDEDYAKVTRDAHIAKNDDGTYDSYTLVKERGIYVKERLTETPAYWDREAIYASLLKLNFPSFSFLKEDRGYFASYVECCFNGETYSAKNVFACFKFYHLESLSITLDKETEPGFTSRLTLMNINSTYVDIPVLYKTAN